MKTNFNLFFYMKNPKNYLKGAAPIYYALQSMTTDQKSLQNAIASPLDGIQVCLEQM